MSDEEIRTIAKAITPRQLASFRNALELSAIIDQEAASPPDVIASPEDVANTLKEVFKFSANEEFWVLFMDHQYRVIGKEQIAEGNIDKVVANVREVLGAAARRRASVIAVAHNHPNGNASPSLKDCTLTNHLNCAGNALQIRLYDHIIFAKPDEKRPKGYYSFREQGAINEPREPVQY